MADMHYYVALFEFSSHMFILEQFVYV